MQEKEIRFRGIQRFVLIPDWERLWFSKSERGGICFVKGIVPIEQPDSSASPQNVALMWVKITPFGNQ